MRNIMISWRGPYHDRDEIGGGDGYGLYLLTGKTKYSRYSDIHYCGITERTFKKRLFEHQKTNLPVINRELEIWIGDIVFPTKINRMHLEDAEKMIIYFWKPTLNERKHVALPEPTTVISYWFKADGTPRLRQKAIYKGLHDVLSWDGEYWRTGNLSVYTNS